MPLSRSTRDPAPACRDKDRAFIETIQPIAEPAVHAWYCKPHSGLLKFGHGSEFGESKRMFVDEIRSALPNQVVKVLLHLL